MSITLSIVIYCLQISILIFSFISYFKLKKLINKTESIDLLIDNGNQNMQDYIAEKFTDLFEPYQEEPERSYREEVKTTYPIKVNNQSMAMKNYHKRRQIVEQAILTKKSRKQLIDLAMKKFSNDQELVKKTMEMYDRETS